MTLAEELPRPWIPNDTLAVRLAAIRVALGEMNDSFAWNVKRAALFCGVDPGSWRNWEAGKHPQDFPAVCDKISRATGCDLDWLLRGGALPNPLIRCYMYSPHLTSVETRFDDPFQLTLGFEAPALASVSS